MEMPWRSTEARDESGNRGQHAHARLEDATFAGRL
jgi:hypothetical protein